MKLGYAETPDYDYMISLFESCIEDNLKDRITWIKSKKAAEDKDGF